MERARPVIYYRKGCDQCEKVLSYLENRKVGYDGVEVTDGSDALDELQRTTGQAGVPTLVHKKEVLRKFDIPELNSFLDRFKLDSRPGDV